MNWKVTLLLLLAPVQLFGSPVASSTAQAFNASTLSPSEPAGTQEDDFVLEFCTIDASDGTWSATDPNAVEIDNQPNTGNTALHAYLGYVIRGATAGSYEFSYSGTSDEIRCTLATYRGQDPSTPLDVVYVSGSHFSHDVDSSCNAASDPITTNTDGAEVILVQWCADVTLTAGAPSNYGIDADYNADSLRTHEIASRVVATAGVETPGVWTHSGTDATDDQISFTIALKPASADNDALLLLGE